MFDLIIKEISDEVIQGDWLELLQHQSCDAVRKVDVPFCFFIYEPCKALKK